MGSAFPEKLVNRLREMEGDRLLLPAKAIVENVRRNRKFAAPYYESREEDEEQVDRHIFFATNGCGDYFCYEKAVPIGYCACLSGKFSRGLRCETLVRLWAVPRLATDKICWKIHTQILSV